MNRTIATGGSVALVVLILGAILLFVLRGGDTEEESARAGAALPEVDAVHMEAVRPSRQGDETEARRSREQLRAGAGVSEESEPRSRTAHPPVDIEEIKRLVYEREIESIERLHLLDELVQTGDAEPRGFWEDDWSGVDDWKRASNGFRLETAGDGTLIFIPDEETARSYTFFENLEVYTYDEANRAFVNEIDYFGKTIVNVVKFINDDVLAMMTISGRKVDLNLYQKKAGQP